MLVDQNNPDYRERDFLVDVCKSMKVNEVRGLAVANLSAAWPQSQDLAAALQASIGDDFKVRGTASTVEVSRIR